jgi:hypothetical protein
VSGEQKISDERLAEIEAKANAATPGPWRCEEDNFNFVTTTGGRYTIAVPGTFCPTRTMHFIADSRIDIPDLCADLRAARAEIERYKEEAVQRAVVDMGTPWQCSGCGHVYRGRLKRACDVCHRAGYYSGSVHREALAKYDAKQAARIRAGGGVS